jgi:hydroxyethylthiazole kinase-like uncharacterized protein yjeF
VVVDGSLLRRVPLPAFEDIEGKDDRGSVLVVGGSRETPGGVLLAGVAALRAGAGRIQLATAGSVAVQLAIAVPEARVISLHESRDGSVSPHAADALRSHIETCDTMLIGSGAMSSDATGELLRRILADLPRSVAVVVDAAALPVLGREPELVGSVASEIVLVPNPPEMAHLLGCDVELVKKDPQGALHEAIRKLNVAIALRGPDTWMSAPGERVYVDQTGHAALATAGSGDVLAGVLAGLVARGADRLGAILWAVHAHATAGHNLAQGSETSVGLIATDLLDEIPRALAFIERP